jgi:hypothetical protein
MQIFCVSSEYSFLNDSIQYVIFTEDKLLGKN